MWENEYIADRLYAEILVKSQLALPLRSLFFSDKQVQEPFAQEWHFLQK